MKDFKLQEVDFVITKRKTEKHKITQIALGYMDFEDDCKRLLQKKNHKCLYCEKPFEKNEEISLVSVKGDINRFVCNECAESIVNNEKVEMCPVCGKSIVLSKDDFACSDPKCTFAVGAKVFVRYLNIVINSISSEE